MTFSFVQITDHHLGESSLDHPHGYPVEATFQAILNHISDTDGKFDFLVSTGDLVNKPNEVSYNYTKSLLGIQPVAQIPGPHFIHYGKLQNFPAYILPGNHDDRDVFFRSLYLQSQPGLMNASFVHKGVNFVMVDWGPLVQGVLSEELLSFLEKSLDNDLPAVLLMHHNIVPVKIPLLDNFMAENIEPFYECLKGKNILSILCGHLHTTYEINLNGFPVLGLRSTAFQFKVEDRLIMSLMPLHYRIVTIDDQFHLTSRIVEVPLPVGLLPESSV